MCEGMRLEELHSDAAPTPTARLDQAALRITGILTHKPASSFQSYSLGRQPEVTNGDVFSLWRHFQREMGKRVKGRGQGADP